MPVRVRLRADPLLLSVASLTLRRARRPLIVNEANGHPGSSLNSIGGIELLGKGSADQPQRGEKLWIGARQPLDIVNENLCA
jgi:hypothetical protein